MRVLLRIVGLAALACSAPTDRALVSARPPPQVSLYPLDLTSAWGNREVTAVVIGEDVSESEIVGAFRLAKYGGAFAPVLTSLRAQQRTERVVIVEPVALQDRGWQELRFDSPFEDRGHGASPSMRIRFSLESDPVVSAITLCEKIQDPSQEYITIRFSEAVVDRTRLASLNVEDGALFGGATLRCSWQGNDERAHTFWTLSCGKLPDVVTFRIEGATAIASGRSVHAFGTDEPGFELTLDWRSLTKSAEGCWEWTP